MGVPLDADMARDLREIACHRVASPEPMLADTGTSGAAVPETS